MHVEAETFQLYIRALNHYLKRVECSKQEKNETQEILALLTEGKEPSKASITTLCTALTFYLERLKTIENLMITDPLFLGFDGSNPLLIALNKEVSFTLETKGHTCHDLPKRRIVRIDW